MKDHNGVLMMQRALLAGTLGLAMAQKAAAILDGEPRDPEADRGAQGAVLRAILDAANECLGHFDDRPAGERWCDTLFHLLDLAAFAAVRALRSDGVPGCAVASLSPESPQVAEAADLVVDGPAGVVDLLRALGIDPDPAHEKVAQAARSARRRQAVPATAVGSGSRGDGGADR